MRIQDLPVYGPTDPFGDEEHEPDVIVRVDFLMSREQLVTALGMAWAEIAGDRSPESLTVLEVRHEVEAWLSVQAFFALSDQMERDQSRPFSPEQQRVMQVLAAAIDQAYPPRRDSEPRPVQQPRYGNGTVTLATVDRGEVTVDEPVWCVGHDGEPVGHFTDITHGGPHITAAVEALEYSPVPLLRANVTHAPNLEQSPEPHPVAYVEGMEAASFDAAGLRHLAGEGRVWLARIEAMADELDNLAGGAS